MTPESGMDFFEVLVECIKINELIGEFNRLTGAYVTQEELLKDFVEFVKKFNKHQTKTDDELNTYCIEMINQLPPSSKLFWSFVSDCVYSRYLRVSAH